MIRRYIVSLAMALTVLWAAGDNPVLQVFNGLSYKPLDWNDIARFSPDTDKEVMNFQLADGEIVEVPFADMTTTPLASGPTIPLIEITTDESLIEIPDKINYKSATLTLNGFGGCENLTADVNIRGRGNTSWNFDKKPYRLKFSKKISLCGLPKAKNYVLLANYSDPSLMQFALACRIAQMLEMPYAPRVKPVDVVLNGQYKGSYLLCNKPGINAGSVDIDENTSIMWELDVNYDEDYKFMSPVFQLPVQAVDPDLDDVRFQFWKADFIEMEKAVSELDGANYIDMDEFAKYILVYDILANSEIAHPKSVKLYKTEGGKYVFGPIWDFDWCMATWGFDGIADGEYYIYNEWPYPVKMHPFLTAILNHPQAREAVKKHWLMLSERLDEIYKFIDDYAATIRASALMDKHRWNNPFEFDSTHSLMKSWLKSHTDSMKDFEYLK